MKSFKLSILTILKQFTFQRLLAGSLCLFFLMSIGMHTALPVAAQAGEEWTDPVNLSRSGAATNPQIVVDSEGLVHVIWQDAYAGGDGLAGWVYSFFDGELWSVPQVVNFPFNIEDLVGELKFAGDGRGRIHAFWLDSDGSILYSWAAAGRFGESSSWAGTQVIAVSALALEVVSDSQGDIHLTYIRPLQTIEAPAGVYYRRTANSGDSWMAATPLYQSPYFRGLTQATASVDIATGLVGEEESVYVTWDNHPRREVHLAVSRDGGLGWAEPVLVDRPDPDRGLATPYNLMAGAQDGGAMLLWQVGEPGSSCRQYYRWSADGGETWTEPLPMLSEFSTCPQENRFFSGADGSLLLMSNVSDSIYLLLWNGEVWSEPQPQGMLRGFEDSELLTQVSLGCRQAAVSEEDHLYVVGCDQAGGEEIWLTSRSLRDSQAWLGTPLVWSAPAALAESSSRFSEPLLVADAGGNMHAFWSQVVDEATNSTEYSDIFYARWDGERWSSPRAVFSSPDESYLNPAVAYSQDDRLLLSWIGSETGLLYYSWAIPARALRPDDWTLPQAVPVPRPAASSPFILPGVNGVMGIVYAIPVNEMRGVYLVQSDDGGGTWSVPALVFDGAQAGWEMVDRPRLARTGDGVLQTIFERYSQPGGSGSLGIYTARSLDGGQTWSEAEAVTETPVGWSQIFSDGAQSLHRLWQDAGSGAVWQDYSLDGGGSWSLADRAPALSILPGTAGAAIDLVGRLHLFAIVEQSSTDLVMQHWSREGTGWQAQEGLKLVTKPNDGFGALSAAISPGGRLGVIYQLASVDPVSRLPVEQLIFTTRDLELGEAPPPLPTPEPQPTPTSPPATTPDLFPTPTMDPADLFAAQEDLRNPSGASNQWMGIILGAGLALILVGVSFVVAVRAKQKKAGAPNER